MNVNPCPECGGTEHVEFVTVTFNHWELDEDGRTTGEVETHIDHAGIFNHLFCEACVMSYDFNIPEEYCT